MKLFTAGCIFSGMGGLASGFTNSRFRLLWASDKDCNACATFQHRFPSVRVIEKDIRDLKVEVDKLLSVDVLLGGFPCQSFSQAGTRRGFNDSRGKLFFQIPRLLKEFGGQDMPRLVVLENVPNLLSGASGTWFAHIRHALCQAGYWFRREYCWSVNVCDATNVPQDRKRLFMVAASRQHFPFNPFVAPDSSLEKRRSTIYSLIDRSTKLDSDLYLKPNTKYHDMISNAIANGTSSENIYQLRRSYVREKKNGLCPTLTANMGLGGHNVPFIQDRWGIRRLTIHEVARLKGFGRNKDLFPAIPNSEKYRLLGNSVCVALASLLGRECHRILAEEL